MKLIHRSSLTLAVAFALATPTAVFATNGMYMIGYGAKATGMGGAGVAYPQDAMAPAYNPAGMTEVGQMRFDATLELFYPPRAVSHESSALPTVESVKSKDNLFPIPALGAVMSDPSTPLAMGMAIVGAGLGTKYGTNFYDPGVSTVPVYKKVGVFLMQMQMLPSAAYRVNDQHSIGASIVIAAQTFKAFGLEGFASSTMPFTSNTDKTTNNGYDWGFGFGYKLGWLGKFFDKRVNVGLSYSPRVEMQKFNRYEGLFANHGEFDIPTNYALGLAFKVTPKANVAFDVQRIRWSEVRSIGNPGPNVVDINDFNPQCPGSDQVSKECDLGGDLGMGFGWTDQTVYKLGMDYKWSPTLTVRAGLNYGKAPIPEDQVLFNMLAPATTEEHITFGFTQMLDKDSDFNMTFMHAFENTIKGPTAFPPPPGLPVQGSNAAISMSQTSLSLAYGLRF